MANIGQLCGLVGTLLFAISLILSVRTKWMDRLFKGLNNLYKIHHYLGQIAFCLLLVHPLFLIPKYAGNMANAAKFLLPDPSHIATNPGIFSLFMMILLLVLTLYLRPKYNIWKWTHKFLGLAFFLASLHVYLIVSDTSRFWPLKLYMLTFIGLGLVSFVGYSLLGRFLIKKYAYQVVKVTEIAADTWEIQMSPVASSIKFKPGQFVFVSFKDKNIGNESHPFSISSGVNDRDLSITVKNLGDYTAKLSQLKSGTPVIIEGAYGALAANIDDTKKQIWIAGGIGITPFISLAKSRTASAKIPVEIYYCFRSKEQAAHLKYLQSLPSSFTLIPFCAKDQGRLSAEIIKETSGPLENTEIIICAPPAMIQSLRRGLKNLNINNQNIHSEEFSF
jgi:predicted ferric reductase